MRSPDIVSIIAWVVGLVGLVNGICALFAPRKFVSSAWTLHGVLTAEDVSSRSGRLGLRLSGFGLCLGCLSILSRETGFGALAAVLHVTVIILIIVSVLVGSALALVAPERVLFAQYWKQVRGSLAWSLVFRVLAFLLLALALRSLWLLVG